jgi:hypothetical protein
MTQTGNSADPVRAEPPELSLAGVAAGRSHPVPGGSQAFSHLALINAVMHLLREDERLGDAAFRARLP